MIRVPISCLTMLLVLSVSAVHTVGAQTLPGQADAERGAELTERLCANCHIPEEGAPRLQGTADVPTFPEIARKQGQTAERISGAIIMPAHPMPQIPLTKSQIDDVVAYIMSLK